MRYLHLFQRQPWQAWDNITPTHSAGMLKACQRFCLEVWWVPIFTLFDFYVLGGLVLLILVLLILTVWSLSAVVS